MRLCHNVILGSFDLPQDKFWRESRLRNSLKCEMLHFVQHDIDEIARPYDTVSQRHVGLLPFEGRAIARNFRDALPRSSTLRSSVT